jgi:hypothetical protein
MEFHITPAGTGGHHEVKVTFDGSFDDLNGYVFAALCGLAQNYIEHGGDTMQGTLQALEENLEIDLDPDVVTASGMGDSFGRTLDAAIRNTEELAAAVEAENERERAEWADRPRRVGEGVAITDRARQLAEDNADFQWACRGADRLLATHLNVDVPDTEAEAYERRYSERLTWQGFYNTLRGIREDDRNTPPAELLGRPKKYVHPEQG